MPLSNALKSTIHLGYKVHSTKNDHVFSCTCFESMLVLQVPELPKVDELCFAAKNYWNKGVIASFIFLSNLPNKTTEWSRQGYDYVVRQLELSQEKNPNTAKGQDTLKQ